MPLGMAHQPARTQLGVITRTAKRRSTGGRVAVLGCLARMLDYLYHGLPSPQQLQHYLCMQHRRCCLLSSTTFKQRLGKPHPCTCKMCICCLLPYALHAGSDPKRLHVAGGGTPGMEEVLGPMQDHLVPAAGNPGPDTTGNTDKPQAETISAAGTAAIAEKQPPQVQQQCDEQQTRDVQTPDQRKQESLIEEQIQQEVQEPEPAPPAPPRLQAPQEDKPQLQLQQEPETKARASQEQQREERQPLEQEGEYQQPPDVPVQPVTVPAKPLQVPPAEPSLEQLQNGRADAEPPVPPVTQQPPACSHRHPATDSLPGFYWESAYPTPTNSTARKLAPAPATAASSNQPSGVKPGQARDSTPPAAALAPPILPVPSLPSDILPAVNTITELTPEHLSVLGAWYSLYRPQKEAQQAAALAKHYDERARFEDNFVQVIGRDQIGVMYYVMHRAVKGITMAIEKIEVLPGDRRGTYQIRIIGKHAFHLPALIRGPVTSLFLPEALVAWATDTLTVREADHKILHHQQRVHNIPTIWWPARWSLGLSLGLFAMHVLGW
eukprot:GHRR01024619.1.p1 GENE.GHRR01024619.1~~GHRR01024619.1.p1  ORF type:complete len:550 (+),score=191.79 GHRR01024619.1:830-2479(+)